MFSKYCFLTLALPYVGKIQTLFYVALPNLPKFIDLKIKNIFHYFYRIALTFNTNFSS